MRACLLLLLVLLGAAACGARSVEAQAAQEAVGEAGPIDGGAVPRALLATDPCSGVNCGAGRVCKSQSGQASCLEVCGNQVCQRGQRCRPDKNGRAKCTGPCKPSGGRCANQIDCCQNTSPSGVVACAGGVCGTCKPQGAICGASSECCETPDADTSADCNARDVCSTCKVQGASCNDASECCRTTEPYTAAKCDGTCGTCSTIDGACATADDCCGEYDQCSGTCYSCFPAAATVATPDRGAVTMAQLRPGDRVLAVGRDGRLAFEEVYLISHRDPAAAALYHTVEALDASGEPRRMQLSGIHYLPAARDATGACAALAAGGGAEGSADALHAWSLAALHLGWAEHRMLLPTALSPGMVAFTAHNGTAAPACILSVSTSAEAGAFNPLVRAPGIVVDGVVASPLARWGTVYGNPRLPAAVDHRLPAIQQALLSPAYWLTRLAGPRLVWRLNQHPLFGAWNAFHRTLVYSELALALLVAAAAIRHARRARSALVGDGARAKAE